MKKYYYMLEKKNVRIILIGVFIIAILNMEFLYNELNWVSSANTPYLRYVLTASTKGHWPVKIIIWFLALYPLLLGIESTMQELSNKSHYLVITRIGRIKYIKATVLNNMKLPLFFITVGLFINFIILFIGFHGNEFPPDSVIGMFQSSGEKYYSFQYNYPYLMVLFSTIILQIVIICISVQGTLLALLIEDRKIVYALTFGLYYFFVSSSMEITGILQPFDEYGFSRDFIPFVIFMLVYIVVILVTMLLVRKKYETIY